MKVEDMIKYLRTSVYIQDKDQVIKVDPQYLCMTDEDIESYLEVVKLRNYPDVPSLALMPEESIYGLIILAKKELYCTLAVKEAPLYDLGADNNNYLKRSQRFDHYMKLAEDAGKEYDDWLENGGEEGALGTVTTHYVTISDRYNTRYNYERGAVPKVVLYVLNVLSNSVEFFWKVKSLSRFKCYKVYLSNENIVDQFNTDSHIAESASCIKEIKDIHQTMLRITDLQPETEYHIAIEVQDLAGHHGYAEVVLTTSEEEGE